MPLNNKETILQRQISIEREETEAGLEALEEPLKAKKRRESRQGTIEVTKIVLLVANSVLSCVNY